MDELQKEVIEEYNEPLVPLEEFYFPFPAYQIQKDFMTNLYRAIEERKLGIFESPTGTGKTLSIICGALSWLKDHEIREINRLEKAIASLKIETSNNSKDWLTAQVKNIANENCRRRLQLQLDKINQKKEKVKKIKEKHKNQSVKRKQFNKPEKFVSNQNGQKIEENVDKPLILDEDEDIILEDGSEVIETDEEEKDEEAIQEQHGVKIIFCSRTHSQLSQFINEIKRTIYSDDIRLVHLASRQIFCINKAVQKLSNTSLINDKCLDLQRSSKSKASAVSDNGEILKKHKGKNDGGCCPKLKGLSDLGEKIIVSIQDVEEILKQGEELGSCPYYATRQVVEDLAQVIVVPYNTLLHKRTREACGIKVDNNVIIVDEAHNLLETVSHIHSTQISGCQLTHAYSQITQYRDKYEKRFSAINLLHLNQLIYVVGALIKLIGGKAGCGPNEASLRICDTKVYTVTDFIMTAEIDNYNIYKLLNFCKTSKITHKLHGFTERYAPLVKPQVTSKPKAFSGMKAFLQDMSNKKNPPPEQKQSSQVEAEVVQGQPLIQILSFLENLTQDYREGRVVMCRQMTIGKSTIKYLLLDPSSTLSEIIVKARSVILAGGTMQPVSEFKERLFYACGADKNRVLEFSCGHVIPSENILPIVVCSGPTGKQLEFSFKSRDSPVMLNELGRLLINICSIVPAGIVCFFPSYDYESKVHDYLDKNGMLKQLSLKKKIFREPKKSVEVDNILAEYSKTIKQKNLTNPNLNGALMFSVVGGKLSEGLNFSDDLGRCVIVVGMPYPNIKSPELLEKINYLNEHVNAQAGREHYENLCMKAVNQSIGRAIRHRGDYSSMLLLDNRYARSAVQELLPHWIRSSVKIEQKFGPILAHLVKFFKIHRSKQLE